MSGFDLAFKILHIKTKMNDDLIAYVVFPFNLETATQYEIDSNNQRFAQMGFGSKYVCFYPSKFVKHGDEISLSPWLDLTNDEWVAIDLADCLFAVPVEVKYETQYQDFLKNRAIDVEQTVIKYMSFHNVIKHDDSSKIVVDDYQRPLLPGASYVLDYSIPPNRTLH